MATDAVIHSISPVAGSAGLAWPAARKVQSFPGMSATEATDGTSQARTGRLCASAHGRQTPAALGPKGWWKRHP
jgi:hypothetical protein